MGEGMSGITLDDFFGMNSNEYIIADARSSYSYDYGRIDDAINIPATNFDTASLDKSKKIIVYHTSDEVASELSGELVLAGFNAVYLKGGYKNWLNRKISANPPVSDITERAEKSIQKKYHKALFTKFAKAINQYKLLEENDRVAVCISGGKDSVLMAKLFQELHRHNKFHFELVFLVMDPGYSAENRRLTEYNARILDIPITVFESKIFDAVYNIEKSPCYVCARMRRGYLYSQAKAMGCNKIALGHHFDDVIETILMGMLYGAQTQTMMPKLKSTNFEGMELIRPMYLIREDDIKAWRDYNGLHFLQCACRFTEKSDAEADRQSEETSSKRLETKRIIAELKKTNPYVENNIFKSMENINLETVISYKDKSGSHNFLDNY